MLTVWYSCTSSIFFCERLTTPMKPAQVDMNGYSKKRSSVEEVLYTASMYLPKRQIGAALCPVCWGPSHGDHGDSSWPSASDVQERFDLIGKHGVRHIALWAVGALQSPGTPNISALEAAWRPWLPQLRSFLAGKSLKGDDADARATDLRFERPVAMPLYCPKAVCHSGGSTAADSFRAFGGDASGNVIGSVNRSVVWSSTSGSTWKVLSGAVAKEGLAKSALGPGLPYACGPGLMCSMGNANINASRPSSLAIGDRRSEWNVTKDVRGGWEISRTVLTDNISFALPSEDLCLLSGYSGTP